jgi:hypothetical protein
MKRSTLCTALMIATIAAPLWNSAAWADDAHHPAQGKAAQTETAPPSATSAALSQSTIKALQEALSKQGIAVKADGVLDDETRAAIKTYQTQHHLPVTGEPDKATLDKLGVASTQTATSARGQSAPPPDAHGQPGQTQGGMMMNCPTMQSGQAAQGGMANCPMMPSQAQPGSAGQQGQTQGMGQGMGPGMMHGMGPGQMQPGPMQPGNMRHPPTANQ